MLFYMPTSVLNHTKLDAGKQLLQFLQAGPSAPTAGAVPFQAPAPQPAPIATSAEPASGKKSPSGGHYRGRGRGRGGRGRHGKSSP